MTMPYEHHPNHPRVQEGDIILIEEGQTVYTMLPRHLAYRNCEGEWDELVHKDIRIAASGHAGGSRAFDSRYLAGEYVVTKTISDGGGRDTHGGADYPDGHHVFATKVNNGRVKIDFYQTGCFTAMIPDVKVVGRAEMTWKRKQKET